MLGRSLEAIRDKKAGIIPVTSTLSDTESEDEVDDQSLKPDIIIPETVSRELDLSISSESSIEDSETSETSSINSNTSKTTTVQGKLENGDGKLPVTVGVPITDNISKTVSIHQNPEVHDLTSDPIVRCENDTSNIRDNNKLTRAGDSIKPSPWNILI